MRRCKKRLARTAKSGDWQATDKADGTLPGVTSCSMHPDITRERASAAVVAGHEATSVRRRRTEQSGDWQETDKADGTLPGVTSCSMHPDITRERASATVVAGHEATSVRRRRAEQMATGNPPPVQSHWCPTPEDSTHARRTSLSDVVPRTAELPSRGCSDGRWDCTSEPSDGESSPSYAERSCDCKQPVYCVSDLQLHVQWARPQMPEGKLDVRNLDCSPVSAHSAIIPCFGNCEINGQCENVVTEKQQVTNKLNNNFNHKKKIKDDMLLTIKISETLEKMKTLKRKLSNSVGNKMLHEINATKKTVKSPEVSTRQMKVIQEFYPKTRENISPTDKQMNAVRRYMGIKTSEKNNIKEHNCQQKEIFRIQSNGTKKKERLRREDDSHVEVAVTPKAEKEGKVYAGRSEKMLGNENHSSAILQKELSTECNVYCGCYTSNITNSRRNQVDLERAIVVTPRQMYSCHRDIANEESQNETCNCYNTDWLNRKCNAHRAKGGSNAITSHVERVNKNGHSCKENKENKQIFQVSAENKHKSTALGVPTEHSTEVNDMQRAANHSSLLVALTNQNKEQATTKDIIISSSSVDRGIRKRGKLFYSKIKMTPNMNISRSLAMEVCALITKIEKVVPDQKYCPFVIKNINLTEKHFKNFISKHKARFLNDSPKLSSSNSSVLGQSAKKYKRGNCRFTPKTLRNKADILPSAYCAMESDYTSSAHSTLMMPQQNEECISMSFEKDDKSKERSEIISRSKWNTDAGTVSHDVIDEKRKHPTLQQFEINGKSACGCLEMNLRRNKQTHTPMASKVLEDTCFSKEGYKRKTLYMRNDRDHASEELTRHDTKTRTMSTKNIRKSGETNCNGICSEKVESKNTVFKPLFSMKPCQLNKRKRKYHPLKGEAGFARTPRKTFGTRSSHFYRLFYLCTLREAFGSTGPEKKLQLCPSTKKSVKSTSEPTLPCCPTQLPDDCRSDSCFLHDLFGQKKPATLDAGQIMELTSKEATVWSSGDAASKEQHDSLDLQSCSNKSSDESKSTRPTDKFLESLKLTERRQDLFIKSNEERLMPPKGQKNEKNLSQSYSFPQQENEVRLDKEGAKEDLQVSSKHNFAVIVHPLLDSCVSVDDCTVQEQELTYRTKPDKESGETNSRNDSNKQSFDWQALSKITAAYNEKEEKSDCWLNDDEIVFSSDQTRFPKDSASLLSVENESVFTAQTTDSVIFEGDSNCMNDIVVYANGKERFNNELFSLTNEESKVTEKETKRMRKENLQDRSNTCSMLNQTTRNVAHIFRPSNADGMGNDVTEATGRNETNNQLREKNLEHVQNSQTAHEIVHGLLLDVLASVHATYLNVALESTDHSAMNAESVGTENVGNVKQMLLRKEDIDKRAEEKHNRKGAVKKMLELYLGSNARSEYSDLEAERQARRSEMRTLPRGMVRKRREMFAKMKLFHTCSDSERSRKRRGSTSPHEPSVHAPSVECDRQATVVQGAPGTRELTCSDVVPPPVAVVPPVRAGARSHCGQVSLTHDLEKPASDENTLSLPSIFFLLFLYFMVNMLSNH